MSNRKRNNWRIPDISEEALRNRLRSIAHAPNGALIAEAMRQEQDPRRLRRLFGVNPIAR